jgi:hypothetical protein
MKIGALWPISAIVSRTRPPNRAARMAEAKRLTAEAPASVPSTPAASIPDTPFTIAMDTIWARMIECPTQPM